jgi:endo-1,4-beta-D-glucanase Y/4-amino-4-deoxy-L-arabinose transferase-like glycosyltransferase
MLNNILSFIKRKSAIIILSLLIVVSGVSHGYNMFHFPYYENDEGTYMSQAWSLLNNGELSPYTYWYDHAPMGWFLIAFWVKLTGGFFTFGHSINSGRVLMLFLHLLSSVLLFYIANKLTKRNFAGILAVLVFSLSPLGIYFQRRVLLDNIMIFWILLSLAILLKNKLKLSQILLSAITFGIAVLTKENAVFMLPVFWYLIYTNSHKVHKAFALIEWTAIFAGIVSTYLLYAFLNGEFFPAGYGNDNGNHVSLVTTLNTQLTRGNSLPLWDKQSDFYLSLESWFGKDKMLVVLGALSTVVGFVLSFKEKKLRLPTYLSLCFWFFILRGKLVIDFYVIPLVPLIGLNIGVLADYLAEKVFVNKRFLINSFKAIILLIFVGYFANRSIGQYVLDETTPQLNAMNWVFENVSTTEVIAIDDFAEVEFREKGYTNAAWFWKFWSDPEVQEKYEYNWRNIDYLFLSHEMLRQMGYKHAKNDVLRNVYYNADKVAMFGPTNTGTYVDLTNFVTTNGDWVAIYKLKPEEELMLSTAWEYYKHNYIVSYGQVIDKSDNDKTTSEGQSYAMLRAVWQNDKEMFNSVWSWTKDHMQFRIQDNLFSWVWIKGENGYKQGDTASATDADEDIALALLFAYKTWNDPTYLDNAKLIIDDIWNQEVIQIGDRYYLTAGSDAWRNNKYIVNPSYISPATYRIFAEVDKSHDWNKLAGDSYYFLNKLQNTMGKLPSNWVILDSLTGEITSASEFVTDPDSGNYGFDAFRLLWRVSLDAKWFQTKESLNYLNKIEKFYSDEWEKEKNIKAIYKTSGSPASDYSSLSTSTGALSVFSVLNKNKADDVYNALFHSQFNDNEGYWGDKNNYYDQNWAWFATALYSNKSSNLWAQN